MTEIMDFDAERGERRRKFKIGGETFEVHLGLRPEDLFEADQITEESKPQEVVKAIDGMIGQYFTDPAELDRWRQVRENKETRVTMTELLRVLNWLVSEETGRPPTQPSPSSASPETNGTISTVISSTEPAVASTA